MMNRIINKLRKNIAGEEFDYQVLLDNLREYERPRDRITELLKRKEIIRVKKGIYVFGEDYTRSPVSKEILANMIYGPSYLSLDYALNYYGLIPERVEALTSVTIKRSRRFSTPIGLFIYRGIPLKAYQAGFDQVTLDDGRSFLIAVPEKAICDKIDQDRGTAIRTQSEMRSYLIENLRIGIEEIRKLNEGLVAEIAGAYRSRKIKLLSAVIGRLSREKIS
jgi:predicted transcriptional regulator of viral defense system